MKLKDFCTLRNLQVSTVAKRIKRNASLFEKHIFGVGGEMELDDTAVQLLENVYPLIASGDLISESEVNYLRVINGYKDAMIRLLQELNTEKQKQLMLTETAAQTLAENVVERNLRKEAEERCLEQATKIGQQQAELSSKDSRIAELEQQLRESQNEQERLKNRSFWKRLLNKY